MAFRPPQIHPHEHLGEVGGVDATGLGADRDERLALVVLAGQQRPNLELAECLADRRQLDLGLGERVGVALLLGHLEQDAQVVEPPAQRLNPGELALDVRQAARDALGLLLVVPQIRSGGLLVEVGQLTAHLVEVEDRLDAAQRLVELLELLGDVHGCHVD